MATRLRVELPARLRTLEHKPQHPPYQVPITSKLRSKMRKATPADLMGFAQTYQSRGPDTYMQFVLHVCGFGRELQTPTHEQHHKTNKHILTTDAARKTVPELSSA